MKARLAVYLGIVIAIVGVFSVATVRVLSHDDKADAARRRGLPPRRTCRPFAPKHSPATFTIGRETTYVTGPVDEDGCINYAAALNERTSKGVTPDDKCDCVALEGTGAEALISTGECQSNSSSSLAWRTRWRTAIISLVSKSTAAGDSELKMPRRRKRSKNN